MFQMTANVAETGVAGQELTQFVERVERLEEKKKAISGDIREVYADHRPSRAPALFVIVRLIVLGGRFLFESRKVGFAGPKCILFIVG
jgi:Uncharacterized protein conserved in bacteria (DUF2312)